MHPKSVFVKCRMTTKKVGLLIRSSTPTAECVRPVPSFMVTENILHLNDVRVFVHKFQNKGASFVFYDAIKELCLIVIKRQIDINNNRNSK